MSREEPDVYQCEMCAKAVSRLLGVGAQIEMPDGHLQVKTAVLGFCAEHRDQVVPAWLTSLSDQGRAESVGEPVTLRPKEAQGFLAYATRALANGVGGYEPIDPATGSPTQCPHCGADLRWGEGPHANDERVQAGNAFAWECAGCGAAGLLGIGL